MHKIPMFFLPSLGGSMRQKKRGNLKCVFGGRENQGENFYMQMIWQMHYYFYCLSIIRPIG